MTITEKTGGLVEISTDAAHILHRIGSEDYTEVRRVTVRREDAGQWEEMPMGDIPPYTEAEYNSKVTELIRLRYSMDDEFALINNVMANATKKRQDEYAAYQEYRVECKARAKEILSDKSQALTYEENKP